LKNVSKQIHQTTSNSIGLRDVTTTSQLGDTNISANHPTYEEPDSRGTKWEVRETFKPHLSSYLFSSYEEIETRTWNKLKNQYLDTEKYNIIQPTQSNPE